MWCTLAHKYKVDNHLERVLYYAKLFYEHNQLDIQIPMKTKETQTHEQLLSNLNTNVLMFSSSPCTFSQENIDKNHFEEQTDLPF